MENYLELLSGDKELEFISKIRQEELDFNVANKNSKVDRNVLFPSITCFKKPVGAHEVVLITNLRKKGADGIWYRVYFTESHTFYGESSESFKQSTVLILQSKMIARIYNFSLNGIVPFDLTMSFCGEPSVIKCAWQWLSEEDRMAAMSSFLSPAEYIINKFKNKNI